MQVMPVAQPSEWQKDYAAFNRTQLELLAQGQAETESALAK